MVVPLVLVISTEADFVKSLVLLVTPIFLSVTLAVKTWFGTFVNVTEFPPAFILTIPLSRAMGVPVLVSVKVYFSASKGSKNTLVIPELISIASATVKVIELLAAVLPVICFVIVRFEFAKSTEAMFSTGNVEYIPLLPYPRTLGTIRENVL